MSNTVKNINIKNHTYSANDIINIKNFDPKNIKLDERSYQNKAFLITILNMW